MNPDERTESMRNRLDDGQVAFDQLGRAADRWSLSAVQSSSFAVDRPAKHHFGEGLSEKVRALMDELDDFCSVIMHGAAGSIHATVVRLKEDSEPPFYTGYTTVSGVGSDEDSLIAAVLVAVENAMTSLAALPKSDHLASATGELTSDVDADGGLVVEFHLTVG